MKELAALAYRDTTAENREFWKNEMGQALREIQGVYDEKLDIMRGEMETFYNLKVSLWPVSRSLPLVTFLYLLMTNRSSELESFRFFLSPQNAYRVNSKYLSSWLFVKVRVEKFLRFLHKFVTIFTQPWAQT